MSSRGASALARGTESDAVPEEFREYLVSQRHGDYTDVDHAVWAEVLSRNEQLIEQYEQWIPPAYLEGARAMDLPRRVPSVDEINERLEPTGWKTVCVDGYVPTSAYVGLMSRNVFPISRAIRRPEHIDYATAPDLVHDILGHLPMLFSPEHRDFLGRLATVMEVAAPNALDHELYAANRHMSELKSDPASAPSDVVAAERHVERVHRALALDASELTQLTRMYLWSIEFGLMGSASSFWIHGAALLSSPAEFRSVCEKRSRIRPYSIDVVEHDIAFSELQSQYFLARDFAHLDEVLQRYEQRIQRHAGEPRASHVREVLSMRPRPRRSGDA
jgi:phenylalanine-4-hydroxylase